MTAKILVALDLEHGTANDELLQNATKLAAAEGADIDLLTVIDSAPPGVAQFMQPGYEKLVGERVEAKLDEIAARLDAGGGRIETSVRFGGVYNEILAHAAKTGADLIITGSHRPNVADYLLGTNAARVVRHAECSVLVVRPREER